MIKCIVCNKWQWHNSYWTVWLLYHQT